MAYAIGRSPSMTVIRTNDPDTRQSSSLDAIYKLKRSYSVPHINAYVRTFSPASDNYMIKWSTPSTSNYRLQWPYRVFQHCHLNEFQWWNKYYRFAPSSQRRPLYDFYNRSDSKVYPYTYWTKTCDYLYESDDPIYYWGHYNSYYGNYSAHNWNSSRSRLLRSRFSTLHKFTRNCFWGNYSLR